MPRNSIALGTLALCLLAAPMLATADHHKSKENQGSHHYDPVQRAEKHLKGLEKKLNLKAEQQAAWNTYSAAVMERAGERAVRMEEFHGKRGEMHDLDTASKLEKMAQWMRERADRMDAMAKDTRAFQQNLTTEQQTIFDMYWQKHSGRGKGSRH